MTGKKLEFTKQGYWMVGTPVLVFLIVGIVMLCGQEDPEKQRLRVRTEERLLVKLNTMIALLSAPKEKCQEVISHAVEDALGEMDGEYLVAKGLDARAEAIARERIYALHFAAMPPSSPTERMIDRIELGCLRYIEGTRIPQSAVRRVAIDSVGQCYKMAKDYDMDISEIEIVAKAVARNEMLRIIPHGRHRKMTTRDFFEEYRSKKEQ